MNKKVSIIIPVYNTDEKYLRKCINSIKEQTYKTLEIIIIDDGSEENTASICDRISEGDERIKVIHKKNEGVSEARNTGISMASGEWISFVDSDDWIEFDAIEKLVENSKGYDVVIARDFIDNQKQMTKNNEIEIVDNTDELIENLLLDKPKIRTLGAVWGKLYSKKIIEKTRFSKNIKMGEDYLFNFDIFLKVKKAKYIPDFVYHYRNDNNVSATRKYDNKLIEKYKLLFEEFENKMKEEKNKIYKESYNVFIIRQLDYFCILNLYGKNKVLTRKERVKILKEISKIKVCNLAIKRVNLNQLSRKKMIFVILMKLKCFNILDLILNKKRG